MRATRVPWAGLALGAGAWAINTQLTYALVPWTCEHGVNIVLPIAGAFSAIAALGGYMSWQAWKTGQERASTEPGPIGRPRGFLAAVGAGSAALFALIIILQGLASLIVGGCAR
jgi:hypothetical protein